MGTGKQSYKECHEKDPAIEFLSRNGCMHVASYVINKSKYVVLSVSS